MSATAMSSDTSRDRRALLRDSIRLDAVVTGTAGVLLAAGAPVLDGLLGVRPALLVALGVFLIAYAAALLVLARAGAPARWVKAVIAANVLWVAASVVAVLADWLTLTAFGTAFALVPAAAVALLAELQLIALRRSQ
jgi:sulfite exporter TauE/SafE